MTGAVQCEDFDVAYQTLNKYCSNDGSFCNKDCYNNRKGLGRILNFQSSLENLVSIDSISAAGVKQNVWFWEWFQNLLDTVCRMELC